MVKFVLKLFLLVEEEWEVADSSDTTRKWNFSVAKKDLTKIALTSQHERKSGNLPKPAFSGQRVTLQRQ